MVASGATTEVMSDEESPTPHDPKYTLDRSTRCGGEGETRGGILTDGGAVATPNHGARWKRGVFVQLLGFWAPTRPGHECWSHQRGATIGIDQSPMSP
jgi:hypothetical protein